MTCPSHGPCSWPELTLPCLSPNGSGEAQAVDPCLTDGNPIDQAIIDVSVAAAKELVWALTGRQFGQCCVKLRPCRKNCVPCPDVPAFGSGPGGYGVGPNGYGPALINGEWFNISCNVCSECSCTSVCKIPLPYPACCIQEVKIDGMVVDPNTYRIDEFKWLVALDDFCWPFCQDLTKEDTEEGTWSVTVCYGREVPELVLLAAAEMACQLMKGAVGMPCQLPQRLSSMTRQGVTVGFLDPQQFFQDNRTGIYLVDLAVAAFNPHRLTRRPAIWSPDAGPNWTVTTAVPGEPCP